MPCGCRPVVAAIAAPDPRERCTVVAADSIVEGTDKTQPRRNNCDVTPADRDITSELPRRIGEAQLP